MKKEGWSISTISIYDERWVLVSFRENQSLYENKFNHSLPIRTDYELFEMYLNTLK